MYQSFFMFVVQGCARFIAALEKGRSRPKLLLSSPDLKNARVRRLCFRTRSQIPPRYFIAILRAKAVKIDLFTKEARKKIKEAREKVPLAAHVCAKMEEYKLLKQSRNPHQLRAQETINVPTGKLQHE